MKGGLRRILVIALFLLFEIAYAFAGGMKYYTVSSAEWQYVNDICRIAGTPGPVSFGPVTGEELLIALDRAESILGAENGLIVKAKEILGQEKALFASDYGYINLSGALSPEIYAQTSGITSDTPFLPDRNWDIKRYTDRKPIVSATLEAGYKDSIYGKFVMIAKDSRGDAEYWQRSFATNAPVNELVKNFPFEAGVSFGNKGFSFIIARDKVSLGEGITGNTAIGDVLSYQDFFRGGYSGRAFSIHLNITYFDSSHLDKTRSHGLSYPIWQVYNSSFSGWKQIRHTVDYGLIIHNKVKTNLAFIGLLDTDSGFDLRMLNPFMIFHNMFNFHESTILEANNMISLDVSWAISPKWNLYAQLTMDQFQVTGEAEGYYEEFGYTDPNAFGGLINLSYTSQFNGGVLGLYGEFVMNMPGMYLNQKYYKDGRITQYKQEGSQNRCWSQDYLVGYARATGDDEMAFAGYIYGPDCMVAAAGGKYSVYGCYDVSACIRYLARGEKGRGTSESNYDYSGMDTPQTINRMPLVGEEVEQALSLAVEGNYSFFDCLSIYAGFALAYRINAGFSGGNNLNMQIALGCTLKTL